MQKVLLCTMTGLVEAVTQCLTSGLVVPGKNSPSISTSTYHLTDAPLARIAHQGVMLSISSGAAAREISRSLRRGRQRQASLLNHGLLNSLGVRQCCFEHASLPARHSRPPAPLCGTVQGNNQWSWYSGFKLRARRPSAARPGGWRARCAIGRRKDNFRRTRSRPGAR